MYNAYTIRYTFSIQYTESYKKIMDSDAYINHLLLLSRTLFTFMHNHIIAIFYLKQLNNKLKNHKNKVSRV